MSSKNRRKEARKKTNLREGGFYEDIALMRALHMMYDEVHELAKDVREICVLEELSGNQFCETIHEMLQHLQTKMYERRKEIWPEVFYKTLMCKDLAVQAVIQNKNDLGKIKYNFNNKPSAQSRRVNNDLNKRVAIT